MITKTTESAVTIAYNSMAYDHETEAKKVKEEIMKQKKFLRSVKAILSLNAWVWVNGHFVDSEKVAFTSKYSKDSVNCSPFLEIISADYQSFHKLFLECGVRKYFQAKDYANIMNVIANSIDNKISNTLQKKNEILVEMVESDINLAVNIAQYISDKMQFVGDIIFPIPCSDCQSMRYPNQLYYNDAPWISSTVLKQKKLSFVHPKLSIQVCKKLGVQSFRELFVSKQSELLTIEINQQIGTQSFGQHESLTRRLKDILRAYPEGPSIIYEFIQNADDARATKIIVLFNEKEYGTDSLLSTELNNMQGPALYIYNDAVFNEKDFINLSRIGQGSKLQKLEATGILILILFIYLYNLLYCFLGRFGLGFNCCYHLTDVPSLVSGNSIVFFDPHTTHLPNAHSQAPGIRINFLQSDLVSTFPDQFSPFQDYQQIFNCKLDEPFNGTLFRFPLRTSTVAKMSEIKSEMTSVQTVKHILSEFALFAKETLLFLRYISSIELMTADSDGCIHRLLSVQLKHPKVRSQSVWRQFIAKGLRTKSQSTKEALIPDTAGTDSFYRYLQNVRENELPLGIRSLRIITEQFTDLRIKTQNKSNIHFIDNQNENESTDELKIDAINDVLSCIDDNAIVHKIVEDEFVICEKIGGGQSISIACKKANRDLKFIPFACIAAHISSIIQQSDSKNDTNDDNNNNTSSIMNLQLHALQGRAFTFLPLPISTGLPVHLNGYVFVCVLLFHLFIILFIIY